MNGYNFNVIFPLFHSFLVYYGEIPLNRPLIVSRSIHLGVKTRQHVIWIKAGVKRKSYYIKHPVPFPAVTFCEEQTNKVIIQKAALKLTPRKRLNSLSAVYAYKVCLFGARWERKWIASPNLRVIKFVSYFSLSARQRVCSTSSSSLFFLSRSLGIPCRHTLITASCRLTLKKWGFHRRVWRPGRPESQGTPSPNELESRAQTESGRPHTGIAFSGKIRRTSSEFWFVFTS